MGHYVSVILDVGEIFVKKIRREFFQFLVIAPRFAAKVRPPFSIVFIQKHTENVYKIEDEILNMDFQLFEKKAYEVRGVNEMHGITLQVV